MNPALLAFTPDFMQRQIPGAFAACTLRRANGTRRPFTGPARRDFEIRKTLRPAAPGEGSPVHYITEAGKRRWKPPATARRRVHRTRRPPSNWRPPAPRDPAPHTHVTQPWLHFERSGKPDRQRGSQTFGNSVTPCIRAWGENSSNS